MKLEGGFERLVVAPPAKMTASIAPIIDVVQQFKDDFVSTADRLQHQALEFLERMEPQQGMMVGNREQVETEARKFVKETQTTVQDLGPIEAQPRVNRILMDTYLWSAICLLGLGCGEYIGRFLSFNFLMNTYFNVVLVFLLLPAWVYMVNKKQGNNADTRMKLLALTVGIGILSGQYLSTRQLPFWSPPAFLLPLSMAIACSTVAPHFAQDRRIYLALTVGSGTLLYLLFGAVFNSLHVGYVLWVVLASVVATVHLQLQLGRIGGGKTSFLASQFVLIMSFVLMKTMITVLFGTSADQNQSDVVEEKPAPVTT